MRNFFVVNKITGDLEKLYLNNQKDINLVNMKMIVFKYYDLKIKSREIAAGELYYK